MDLLNETENAITDPITVQESEINSEEKKVFTYKEPKWVTKINNGEFANALIRTILF